MQKQLFSQVKKWIKKEKVIDVVLFGSSARGAIRPRDVDLCVIVEDDKRSMDVADSLGKETGAQVNVLSILDFFSGNTLAKTLLQEGVSIVHGKPLAEVFGFSARTVFVYSLKGFSSSKRVRFHYALRGRDSEGVLAAVKGELLGGGVLSVPTAFEDEIVALLSSWDISYRIMRMLGS